VRCAVAIVTAALLHSGMAGATDLDRGAFGPFVRSLNTTPHGYAVAPDPTSRAPTALVERFEVRPGDCGREAWNDCANDRERSELSERGGRSPEGSEAWYGWSVYVPPDWPTVFPAKTALGQFHQEDDHPAWMFQNDAGGYWLDRHVGGGGERRTRLIAPEDWAGRWHRIVVHAIWSRGNGGQFQVWADGELRADHRGPTMTAAVVYFKYGVYRSFLSRYRLATGKAEVPAQIAYFAAVRRAPAREGLEPPG
jgi:hypothetical protein